MSTLARQHLTPEEYLAIDRKAEVKSEYLDGEMFAMSGGSMNHSTVGVNLVSELRNALRGTPCSVRNSDLRVRAAPRTYMYPDATVVRGAARLSDTEKDVLENPVAIFEVLSPSTEGYDRGRKFKMYRQIESLELYVLVAQDRMNIEVYQKGSNGLWVLSEADGADGVLEIPVIGVRIPLSAIYENVTFE